MPPARSLVLSHTPSCAHSDYFARTITQTRTLSSKINARYHEHQRILGDSSSPKDNNGEKVIDIVCFVRMSEINIYEMLGNTVALVA